VDVHEIYYEFLETLTERQCHSKKNSVNHSEITQMVEQHVSLKAAKYI